MLRRTTHWLAIGISCSAALAAAAGAIDCTKTRSPIGQVVTCNHHKLHWSWTPAARSFSAADIVKGFLAAPDSAAKPSCAAPHPVEGADFRYRQATTTISGGSSGSSAANDGASVALSFDGWIDVNHADPQRTQMYHLCYADTKSFDFKFCCCGADEDGCGTS